MIGLQISNSYLHKMVFINKVVSLTFSFHFNRSYVNTGRCRGKLQTHF